MAQKASPSPADVASVRCPPWNRRPEPSGLDRPGHLSLAGWTLWTVSLAEKKPVPKRAGAGDGDRTRDQRLGKP